MPVSHEINAVHEKELPEMLESLGLLDSVKKGLVTCNFCLKKITLENFNCIYPKNNEVIICCGDVNCYRKALLDIEQKEE